jgi:hypothetical protein
MSVRQALASMDLDQVAEGVLSGHGKRMTSATAEGGRLLQTFLCT